MKKILALILCAGFVFLAACGGNGDTQGSTEADSTEVPSLDAGYSLDNYEFYEIDDFSKYVELGQYEGVTVSVAATQEEIDKKVSEILRNYAEKQEITDRDVESGDIVTLDYTGYIDGETFEGGSGTDRTIIVGSNTFLTDFENGLIGVQPGKQIEINLTFPEDYQYADYAGKAAKFEVNVKKIEQYKSPELDDAFANKYNSEYQTVEDFKNGVAEDIKAGKMEESALTNSAWNVVINNCNIKDIPEEMIKYYYDNLYASYVYYVYYNYKYETLEEYVEACDDLTMEQLTDTFMTQAQGYAASEIVYRAICADKGYEITDEAYNEYKDSYVAEKNTEPTDIEIRQALLWKYASQCVLDSVICE